MCLRKFSLVNFKLANIHNLILFYNILTLLLLTWTSFQSEALENENIMTRNPQLLKMWATFEISFLENVASRLTKMVDRPVDPTFLSLFQKYQEDFEETLGDLSEYNGSMNETIVRITTNPIATYRMMRRIVNYLPQLVSHTAKHGAIDPKSLKKISWPQMSDLEDTMMSILRLHNVYNLDTKNFSEGIILNTQTGVELKGIHCYELGILASTQSLFILAVEWLEVALDKTRTDHTVHSKLVEQTLKLTAERHDKLFDDKKKNSNPFFYDRKLGVPSKSKGFRRKQRNIFEQSLKGTDEATQTDVKFWSLCSNGSTQSEKEKLELFCWFETKSHPAWLINPLKMELLSRDPDVLQIYNILGDQKIERIKKTVQAKLKTSRVVVEATLDHPEETRVISGRSSVHAWIDELNDPELIGMSERIEQITGLKVIGKLASEMLQVGSYATGGHYGAHFDALTEADLHGTQKEQGDRIATFMYYLTDVPLGGYTAFVSKGAIAKPIKGSAVFWYNILRDGSRDELTLHGACPVLIGEKWITTTWIRSNEQMSTHHCSKRRKGRFRIEPNKIHPQF